MKRIRQIITVVLCSAAILLFAACDSSEYEEHEQGFTVAHALYDLDYMINMLENNFGLFDVAYWAHGADIHQMAENARREIEDSEIMSYHIFHNIISTGFSGLQGIGRFRIHPPSHTLPEGRPNALPTPEDVKAFADYMGWDVDRPEVYIVASTMLFTDEQFAEMLDRHPMASYIGLELMREILQAARDGDFEELLRLMEISQEIFEGRARPVTMSILEEGEVAYLAISCFLYSFGTAQYWEKFFDFYYEIQDFGHLIVDLRGNGEGIPTNFQRLVIEPNISETITADGFVFMMGDSNDLWHVMPTEIHMYSARPDSDMMTVAEILENFYLPDLNMSDMHRLDYGFPMRAVVHPSRPARFANHQPFDGKIWLLTDEHMGSAAQIVTTFMKDTGFATLVGDVTGGNYGGTRTIRPLYNSHLRIEFDLFYVTDSRGRPFEAGTIPHHFNRLGMDALETTLALIAEGQY